MPEETPVLALQEAESHMHTLEEWRSSKDTVVRGRLDLDSHGLLHVCDTAIMPKYRGTAHCGLPNATITPAKAPVEGSHGPAEQYVTKTLADCRHIHGDSWSAAGGRDRDSFFGHRRGGLQAAWPGPAGEAAQGGAAGPAAGSPGCLRSAGAVPEG